MNPQTEHEIDAAIAEWGYGPPLPEIAWYLVGDHGKYVHCFQKNRPEWRERSYCGIGPAWIEDVAGIARCLKCQKRSEQWWRDVA